MATRRITRKATSEPTLEELVEAYKEAEARHKVAYDEMTALRVQVVDRLKDLGLKGFVL